MRRSLDPLADLILHHLFLSMAFWHLAVNASSQDERVMVAFRYDEAMARWRRAGVNQ